MQQLSKIERESQNLLYMSFVKSCPVLLKEIKPSNLSNLVFKANTIMVLEPFSNDRSRPNSAGALGRAESKCRRAVDDPVEDRLDRGSDSDRQQTSHL